MSEIPSPSKKLKSGGQAGHMDVIGLLEARITKLETTLASAAARAAALETAAMVAMEKTGNNDHTEFLKGQLTHWQNKEEELRKELRELQEELKEELRKRELKEELRKREEELRKELQEKLDKEELRKREASAMRDSSESFFPPLCETSDHPLTYAELPDKLPLLHVPLPMSPHAFNVLHGQYGDRLISLAESSEQPYFELCRVTDACAFLRLNGSSETSVLMDADQLVLDPMELALDSIQQEYRTAFDSSEKSGATTRGLRPDGIISFRDVLMFKFEAKKLDEDFKTAEFELGDKMADWQPALHGSREYLLCFAVAGKRLRFYAVTRGGITSKPISREFRMDKSRDRLEIMHTALRCLQIMLQQLRHQMPSQPVPLGCTKDKGAASVTYYAQYAVKTVKLAAFEENEAPDPEEVSKVYGHIMALPNEPGLGRPRGILKPLEMPTISTDSWRVRMPLGTWEKPRTEEALKCLVEDVLYGLAALHEGGLVHRDVRPPNILQMTAGSYALIDFELSGRASGVPPFSALQHWPGECHRKGAIYEPSVDIYSVGQLMSEYGFELSQPAVNFATMLRHEKPTALQALQALPELWTMP